MPAPSYNGQFATDANFAADGDSWSGSPTKVDPGAGRKAEGFEPDTLPAEWLNWMLNNHGEWLVWLTSLTSGSKVIQISAVDAQWEGSDFTFSGVSGITAAAGGDPAIWDLSKHVPDGASITRVDVLTNPSAGTTEAEIWQVARNFTVPATPTATKVVGSSGATQNIAGMASSGAGTQTIGTGGSLTPLTVDKDAESWILRVTPASATDIIYGVRLSVTFP